MVDEITRQPEPPSEVSVGASLALLRHNAGLTGQQLADLVGMSQAKISRIETGAGSVNPRDVGRLARALQADRDTISRLVERAERSNDRMTDFRPARGAVASMQREVAQLERSTRTFRVFQPTVIVGLAQTSEYARAVLTAAHGIRATVAGDGGVAAVPEAVSARVQRQEVLAEPDRRFHFVMSEAALANRFGRAEDMPAQIQRLRDLAQQDNVTVRIITVETRLTIPPYHGFELLDDRVVVVDVFNTSLTARGRLDVELYRQVFDALDAAATDDIDPILDRYLDLYLDLSRPGPRE